jgi:hypothetical protein
VAVLIPATNGLTPIRNWGKLWPNPFAGGRIVPKAGRRTSVQDAVALSLTVHQPDGRLQALAEATLPALVKRYQAVTALCSAETHPTFIDLLLQQGVSVAKEARSPGGIERLGDTKRDTLRLGLSTGASRVHMCDFDRALHWVTHYPQELDDVIADAARFDYLVLGRTARAWDSHPAYQRHTEWLFNHVYGLIAGQAWDIGAGSRAVSPPAGALLLARSTEPSVGIDAEWPLLVGGDPGLRLGYRACEGLEFETADRYAPEIEAAGGYAAWLRDVESDPGRWAFRLRVAMLIADAALHTAVGRGES